MERTQIPAAGYDLAALATFARIVELGSFTAAGRALGLSQPAVSSTVRRLEEALGARLLVRGRHGARATASGDALLRHARQAFAVLAAAREEVQGLEGEPRGRFRLGCHESLAAYFLPRFMARFLRRYPLIQLSLWNGNSRQVEQAVLDGDVELGIVVNPARDDDTVVQPLFRDRVELVRSRGLDGHGRKRPGALLGEVPLLYVPELRQTQYILGALAQAGLEPRQHLPCSSLELVKSLVLDGVGVGILPMRVAAHGVSRGRVKRVSPTLPGFDDEVAMVRRFDLHLTRGMRLLADELLAHGRGIDGHGRAV